MNSEFRLIVAPALFVRKKAVWNGCIPVAPDVVATACAGAAYVLVRGSNSAVSVASRIGQHVTRTAIRLFGRRRVGRSTEAILPRCIKCGGFGNQLLGFVLGNGGRNNCETIAPDRWAAVNCFPLLGCDPCHRVRASPPHRPV